MNAVTYNPGQKNLGHFQLFVLAPNKNPPTPPPCSVAIWEILRDFQFCEGGGRGDQPGVATLLSGVVGTRRKNTSQ